MPQTDTEKYTHDHIYKTDQPIFINFVAKCWSLHPLSSEIKDTLCEHIPLTSTQVLSQWAAMCGGTVQPINLSKPRWAGVKTLRKFLLDDSVIFIRLYSTSFLSFDLFKNILPTLKSIINKKKKRHMHI